VSGTPEVVSLSQLDSDRFGISVARAPSVTVDTLPEIQQFCVEKGVRLLIASCSGTEIETAQALEDSGLRLMAIYLDYAIRTRERPHDPTLRLAGPEDADEVAAIAKGAFEGHQGHYHADPRLPNDLCNEVYADLARRCCTGEAADITVLAEEDGRICGVSSTRITPPEARGVFAVVAPWAQGRGIYDRLVLEGGTYCAEQNVSRGFAQVSIGNAASQRLLTRLGFRPAGSSLTFHGWFDD
jgi:L-amino acid N-acyltransferase YncA